MKSIRKKQQQQRTQTLIRKFKTISIITLMITTILILALNIIHPHTLYFL